MEKGTWKSALLEAVFPLPFSLPPSLSPQHLAEFGLVARELHGLDGGDHRSERLRQTLRAWFAAGHNATAAAAALGVHEQTVAQRLRTVEERTGHPVAARRAELETALRLRDLLG